MNMKIEENITTLAEIKAFLESSKELSFSPQSKKECYVWIEALLVRFDYIILKRNEKSLIKAFIRKISGYSRAQSTRLISKYIKTGKVIYPKYKRNSFTRKYFPEDIKLLAKTDDLHNNPCGQAVKKNMEREYLVYNNDKYANISNISPSHIYNLRKTTQYKRTNKTYGKTNPVKNTIGERKKPFPAGKPGYIRIDTVHQGDLNKEKGTYHINAVDEVVQWEILATVEKISENYLLPILEEMLDQFPYTIIEFHSDNGSEYINKAVAKLLNKLFIKLTKSRSRKSNDNALVESKNGAIVRKHFGYVHIPRKHADLINEFNKKHLNPYINFHRPCFFPKEKADKKGKIKKTYPYEKMLIPYEKLKSIDNVEKYLKPGITLKKLDAIYLSLSDNEFAERMVTAHRSLFNKISGS